LQKSLWVEEYAPPPHINLLLRLIFTVIELRINLCAPLQKSVTSPVAIGSWATGAGSGWNWKLLVCGLHTGGSGVMVAGVWGWNGRPSGSFQSD